MANVPLSNFLVRGQIYIFAWSYEGTGARQDFADAANAIAGVSQAFVQDLQAYSVSITFAYTGDGSDTVASLQADISNNFPSGNESFQWASVPGVAPPQVDMQTSTAGTIYGGVSDAATSVGNAASKAADLASNAAKLSTNLLWAVGFVAIIGLFIYVGGAGVVKRNIA